MAELTGVVLPRLSYLGGASLVLNAATTPPAVSGKSTGTASLVMNGTAFIGGVTTVSPSRPLATTFPRSP